CALDPTLPALPRNPPERIDSERRPGPPADLRQRHRPMAAIRSPSRSPARRAPPPTGRGAVIANPRGSLLPAGEHAAGEAGEDQAAGFVEEVVLGEDDALAGA